MIIGGTLLSGGRGTIVGSVLGVLIFTTITNIFTLNNLTARPSRSPRARSSSPPSCSSSASPRARDLSRSPAAGTDLRPPQTLTPLTAVTTSTALKETAMSEPTTSGRRLLDTAVVGQLTALHQQRGRRARKRPPPAPAHDAPAKVAIGFAGPQADHGWLNAINDNAKSRAKKYSDVTLEITEGANDTAGRSARSRR